MKQNTYKSLLLKNLDNNGVQATETESLILNKNAFGIRLYLSREENVIANGKQINSFFIQSAYAISRMCPPEYIYSPIDSIISIRVFTLNNFDDQHPENSDITDYFKVAQSYSAVKEHIAKMRFTYKHGYGYNSKPFEKELKIDLMLMTAPTTNNPYQFKIQVTLSDRRIFEQKTTEIQLI